MDFTLNFCEYNRSNSDYDRIFRPEGSGDFLFLLFKTSMKVYLGSQLTVTGKSLHLLYSWETPALSGCAKIPEQLCPFFLRRKPGKTVRTSLQRNFLPQ